MRKARTENVIVFVFTAVAFGGFALAGHPTFGAATALLSVALHYLTSGFTARKRRRDGTD